jgi:hypothetical protein
MLLPGGRLYIMTDVPGLDEHHAEVLAKHSGFEQINVSDGYWELLLRSNQEEFCLSKNIIYMKRIGLKRQINT